MGSTTTTTDANNNRVQEPWAPSVPHLQNIMQAGQTYYGQGVGSNTWQGPDIAPLNEQLEAPLGGLYNTALATERSAGQPYQAALGQISSNGMTPDMQEGMDFYRGQMNSPNVNPFLQQMLDQGASRIGTQIDSTMSGRGRVGSFGHQAQISDRISEFQNPVLAQAYESDQGRRMQSAAGLLSNQQQGAQRAMGYSALAPGLYQNTFAPYERAASVGGYLQDRDQQSLQAAQQRFNTQEMMPWTQLSRYGSAVTGLAPLVGNAGSASGTTSQTVNRPHTFLDYAGLFSGGANSAVSGGANAALGLSMMSDRDEKTDIKKVGESKTTGLPLYAYRYRDDPKTYPKVVGPMAQDIEKKYPGSTERVDGKLLVKPHAAGLLGAL